jgi:hypothetical protein
MMVKEAAICLLFFRIRRPYPLLRYACTSRDATHGGHASKERALSLIAAL